MSNNFKVSIAVTVYNLEQYIEPCINSILNQQTDFDYQIIVGEDCSTDNSRKVLLKLKDAHPNKIKLIFNNKNLGNHANWFSIFEQCETKYIGVMDGDDWWIDSLKLQKQIDFLDAHPFFSMCVTASEQRFESKNKKTNIFRASSPKNGYNIEHIIKKNFINSSTVVFSKKFLKKPAGYDRYPYNDWPLWVELAKKGPIGYIEDITTVYRIHKSNEYGTLNEIDKYLGSLKCRKIMLKYLKLENRLHCYHSIFTYHLRLMHIYLEQKNAQKVREYAIKSLQFIKYYQNNKLWQKIRLTYFRYYIPFIHQFIYSPIQILKRCIDKFINSTNKYKHQILNL